MRVLLTILFMTFVAACGRSGSVEAEPAGEGEGPIKVVVTVPPLAWVAEAVWGDRAEVTVLLPEGASPHGWEPTPSDVLAVREADIVLSTRESEIANFDLKPSAARLSMDSAVVRKEAIGPYLDTYSDEHAWLNPQHMLGFGAVIAGYFKAGTDLENYSTEYRTPFSRIQSFESVDYPLLVITGHEAWARFFQWINVTDVVAMRHDHHDEPSGADITEIRARASEAERALVVLEPREDEPWLRDFAEEIGAATVVLDPVGSRDWLGDMIARYEAVAAALDSLE